MSNDKLAALMDLMPLQGVLYKASSGVSKKWTKRYFQQKDSKLLIFASETDQEQIGEIDLEQVTAVTRVNDPKKPQFQIATPKKTYTFLASSNEEVFFWVDRLTALTSKHATSSSFSSSPSPAAGSPASPLSSSPAAAVTSPTTAPPATPRRLPPAGAPPVHAHPPPAHAGHPTNPAHAGHSSAPTHAPPHAPAHTAPATTTPTPVSPRGSVEAQPTLVSPRGTGEAKQAPATAARPLPAKSTLNYPPRDGPQPPPRSAASTLNLRNPPPVAPSTQNASATVEGIGGPLKRPAPAGRPPTSYTLRGPPPPTPSVALREKQAADAAAAAQLNTSSAPPAHAPPPTPTPTPAPAQQEDENTPNGIHGISAKSAKPPPPKRLPPKPHEEPEPSLSPTTSPASPTTLTAAGINRPSPPAASQSSKQLDQTKKRLPPTPIRGSSGEPTDGEGANEEPPIALPPAEQEAMSEKRMQIIGEIVATEQTYVNNLNIALKKYKDPLLEACSGKDKESAKRRDEITAMFSNMEIIYGLNAELLKSIQECTECEPTNPKYLMVGDVFGRFTPFLKMYQQYSVGYEHAMEIFNKWMKDTVCVNLLKTCNEASGANLKLDHYLIFPIQRIPRYNLLLQDLLKNTPEGHPDRAKLLNSLETNKKVAEHINANLKQADNTRKIVSAVAIDGLDQLMAPARYLIQYEKVEAARLDLTKYDFTRVTDIAKARTSQKERLQIFLFNNLFAVREDKTGSLFSGSSPSRANWQLPLQLWLKDDPGSDTGLLFLGPQEGFYVNFNSVDIRNAWIDSVAELSQGVDNYREFEYSTEDRLYTGRWFAGKFDGTGTLYFYGSVYTGTWFNSMKHGSGKLTYATGDIYEGQWENDLPNGEGTVTYAVGHHYTGEWRDGKRTGKGEMVFAEGRKYDGKWKDDMAYGVGIYTGPGISYDGNWMNGKMHGKGTLVVPMYTYTGFFSKGKREGTGTCEWKDGSKYEGNWKDDKRSGMGKYTCEGLVYDGEWANDKMDGKGKAEYPWGVYKGEFSSGQKSGKGFLYYPSGMTYEGAFKNDLFNGTGTLAYPNGYKWEGKFQNGVPDGKGTMTINSPMNPNSKKSTFGAVLKDNDMLLSVGKEEVKCPCPPEVPVFEDLV
eukprot:Phypoly_transcript_00970.p1 GENE.Phypoly_transcript_00970~~Phypoly_transcript_00970.p1  ORF type:complete len:1129 (-),score=252.32 Phypoly_transcript_00970:187-3573(-)